MDSIHNKLHSFVIYHAKNSNWNSMVKYINIMKSENNITSINFLGNFCYDFGKYNLMKKYFSIAIFNNVDEFNKDCESMYNLGNYYKDIEKNYILMKKYYQMAANLGHVNSMKKLAEYYEMIEIDKEQMKKYYLMINNNYTYKKK